jgi:hypothetical protein
MALRDNLQWTMTLAPVLLLGGAAHAQTSATLPDSPGAVLLASAESSPVDASAPVAQQQLVSMGTTLPPCSVAPAPANTPAPPPSPICVQPSNPLRIVVDSGQRTPLTSGQKARLAVHNMTQPFNLIVLTLSAGIGVASNSHSLYGPGLKGFGRATGYSLLGDATGDFFATYAIPSLTHEDPRYRRMQNAPFPRRVLHALERTVIAEHDNGGKMPNYSTLLTIPITAEISNLYVPGVQCNAPGTASRIAFSIITDPIGNFIAEFLPDIARRIHVRSIFIQNYINQMAGQPNTTPAS